MSNRFSNEPCTRVSCKRCGGTLLFMMTAYMSKHDKRDLEELVAAGHKAYTVAVKCPGIFDCQCKSVENDKGQELTPPPTVTLPPPRYGSTLSLKAVRSR